jgi:hypothetical protein
MTATGCSPRGCGRRRIHVTLTQRRRGVRGCYWALERLYTLASSRSSARPCCFRNAEVGGSNPLTSTRRHAGGPLLLTESALPFTAPAATPRDAT